MAKKNEESYDFKDEKKDKEKTIAEQVDEKMQEIEKQETSEDLHILDIAENPPEPGYMKTELKKAVVQTKDEDDEDITIDSLGLPLNEKAEDKKPPKDNPSIFVNCNGDLMQAYDPILDIDLAMMAEAQVSDCASTIVPMLIDETVELALEEKKARTPEKRKEQGSWLWIVILLMLILIPVLLITMAFIGW